MLVGLVVAGFLSGNSDDLGLIDVFGCYFICFKSEFS